ncbi:hypothetical protein V6N13_046208 [Hibiscus sabdariffa]
MLLPILFVSRLLAWSGMVESESGACSDIYSLGYYVTHHNNQRGCGMDRLRMWSNDIGRALFASLSSRHILPVVGKGVDQIIMFGELHCYKGLPRVKCFLWLVFRGRLMTDEE